MDLSQKNVAIAGSFKLYSHADLKECLAAVGATMTATVTSKTDLLLCGSKGGKKLEKAKSLNITVYDESQLEKLFAPEEDPKTAKTSKKKSNKTSSKAKIPGKSAKSTQKATKKAAKPSKTAAESPPEPAKSAKTPPANPFTGKTVALTGTFATMKRNDAKAMLTKAGANVAGSVSGKTDFLIFGENAGSKVTKAKKLNVKTIPEVEMVAMLTKAGAAGDELKGADQKLAAKKATTDKKMAGVREDIEKANAEGIKKYGLSLANRLLCFLKVFAKRKDVYMNHDYFGAPADNKTLLKWHKEVPHDVLAFSSEFGPCEFTWTLKEFKKETKNYSQGYRGGRIKHPGLKNFRWYKRPSDWDWCEYDSDIMFDDVVAEGTAALSYDPGESRLEASIVFDNANSVTRDLMGDCEDYFTKGAKNAFVWYWQSNDWEGQGFLDKIKANSISPKTPKTEIVKALMKKKLKKLEAEALMSWLGDDIILLLHK